MDICIYRGTYELAFGAKEITQFLGDEKMLSAEKNYEFKKRLLQIHKKDIRDFTKEANKDEFVFKDAMRVSMPKQSDDVIVTAVKDFADFLFTSMGVSVMLGYDIPDADLHIRIRKNDEELGEANGYMGYCLDIGDSQVHRFVMRIIDYQFDKTGLLRFIDVFHCQIVVSVYME